MEGVRWSEWADRFRARLPPPVTRREEDGFTILDGNGAAIRLRAAGQLALVGAAELSLGVGHEPAAADILVNSLVTLATHLARPAIGEAWSRPDDPRGTRTWLTARLAAAGCHAVAAWPDESERRDRSPAATLKSFAPSTLEPAIAHDEPHGSIGYAAPGLRITVEEGVLTLAREAQGWVTSHEQGVIAYPFATLPASALPAARDDAVAVLRALVDFGGARDRLAPQRCRFCHGVFPSLRYHDALEACHSCAERHLGVVH